MSLNNYNYNNTQILFEKVFGKPIADSKEFTTFAVFGDPNPLRILLDSWIEENPESQNLTYAIELENIIMEYIDDNYE